MPTKGETMGAPGKTTPLVVAVDLGTSGPKAAVIAADASVLGSGRAHVATTRTADGAATQDATATWRATVQAIRAAVADAGVSPDNVKGVICSSQYSSIVPLGADGEPTGPMLLWMDQRGAPKALKRAGAKGDSPIALAQWLRIHGLPPIDGGLSLTHMRYLRTCEPDQYRRTTCFLEPMDYLTYKMTGEKTANRCTAMMFLLTDNRGRDAVGFDPTLLGYSGIDRDKLPRLVPTDSVIGQLTDSAADELGLSPTTQVITGLNDTQSGAIGAGAFTGTRVGMSVGSSAVFVTHVPKKHTDVRHAILTMPSPVRDGYLLMAENGNAGAALDSMLDNVFLADDAFGRGVGVDRYAAVADAVNSCAPGAGGTIFLPWLTGTLAPSANSSMRGGWIGMSPTTTRAHMVRAIMEGVALNLRWLRRPAEKFTKRTFDEALYYGGGAESTEWCQIMADVLGISVHQSDSPSSLTCVGAGMLAHERLGNVTFDDIAGSVRTRAVFEPRPELAGLYDDLYGGFSAAATQLGGAMSKLVSASRR